MVELWGKKIGFSQTASSRLQQRVNQDESDHFQQSQETATPTQEHEPISQQPPKTHEPSHEQSPIIHESSQEQPPNPPDPTQIQESPQPVTLELMEEESSDTSRKALVDERSYASIIKTPIATPITPTPDDTTINDDNHHHSIFNMSYLRKPSPTEELDTSRTTPSEQIERTSGRKSDAREKSRYTFEYDGFSYVTYR